MNLFLLEPEKSPFFGAILHNFNVLNNFNIVHNFNILKMILNRILIILN